MRIAGLLRTLVLAMWLAAPAAPAAAQVVIEGDMILLGRTSWRLWGIDAPDARQWCPDGWPAGIMAKTYLSSLVQGRQVVCEPKARDSKGNTVGICRADGFDLGAAMVRNGMAWAYLRFTSEYADEESNGRAMGLGLHQHNCEPAWQWREKRNQARD